MTESAGHTAAVSDTGASGLSQITHGNYASMGYTQRDMFDPLKNLTAAHQLWQNRGGASVSESQAFADWWPYDGGPSNPGWPRYLTAAQSAASGIGGAVLTGVQAAGGLGGDVGVDVGGTVIGADVLGAIQRFVAGGGTGDEIQGDVHTLVGAKLTGDQATRVAALAGVVSWLKTPVSDLQKFVEGALWLINPANWVRIVAGVIGGVLVLLGALLLAGSA
jgi:hypothetical protein